MGSTLAAEDHARAVEREVQQDLFFLRSSEGVQVIGQPMLLLDHDNPEVIHMPD